ncbi:peptidoglycan-binding domain-containing protein [Streptomyces sp. NRRL S-244]|uniref:peptidoglycan-binding domain-containing protein n=1 Tax=Streptomyces sp. NRRL S-244 TaxID=1463897 RepID=UPI0006899BC5|nr:peptidoglycan-binding domain-containing protein [Streptomyces sp. NRRL S-244]
MSHHSDESAGAPDDRLFVRPYVAPSGRPSRATTPAWPHTGPVPVSFRAPEPRRDDDPEPAGSGRERGSRVPLVASALFALALAAAGGTVFLLSGPDPEPRRAVKAPELSVPVLPARSPGAGADAGPSPEGSVRASAPSAAASASAPGPGPGAAGPSAGQTSKPAPPGVPSGPPSSGASGTLRMGDRGPEVRALQERLYEQGFTYVSVTGEYDSQTKRGVAQLQRDRDIKGDQPGVYGPATRAAFGG